MKNFTYRNQQDDPNAMFRKRRRKINKQQIVFNILLLMLATTVILYYAYKFEYITFHGYVRTNNRVVTLIDDAYITDVRVSVGDKVKEGDTLFTFFLTNQILERNNPSQFTNVESRFYDTEIRIRIIEKEIELLQIEKKKEMARLEKVKYDAFIGVLTGQQVENATRRVQELEFSIKNKFEEKKVYQRFLAGIDSKVFQCTNNIRIPAEYTLSELYANYNKFRSEYKHYVAKTDAFITDIKAFNATYTYKGDPMLSFQEEEYEKNQVYVETFVFPEDIKHLSEGKEVEIWVTDDQIYRGTVVIMGTKVTRLPDHLVNKFSNQVEAVTVRVVFNEGQDIPFWITTNDLPVIVRIPRI